MTTDVVFIIGPSRAGSTLLDRMLGEIEGLASFGELRKIWQLGLPHNWYCGCGNRFFSCPFWQEISLKLEEPSDSGSWQEASRQAGIVDRPRNIPTLLSPIKSSQFATLQKKHLDRIERLLEALSEKTGARMVIDSSKEPSTAFLLATSERVRLRLLHLVRDSRGVAYSWTKFKRETPNSDDVEVSKYMPRSSPLKSSLMWNYRNFAAELLGKNPSMLRRLTQLTHLPEYRILRYEDFVADPAREISGILRWLRIDEFNLDFISNRSVHLRESHTVSGNPDRFASGDIPIRNDTDWKTMMKASDKLLVTAITAPFLLRYGYPLRP